MADQLQQSLMGYNPETQEITRQREMAKLLLQQALSPKQGQMIGNRYVGRHPIEGIADLYAAYKANELNKEADQKQQALAELLRKETVQGMQEYNKLRYGDQGTPDVVPQGQTLRDDQGNITYGAQQGTPAIAPNPQAAFNYAMQSRSPMVNQMAAELLKPRIRKEGEIEEVYNTSTGKFEQVGAGKPKLPDAVDAAALFLGLDSKPVSSWTPQERAAVEAKAREYKQAGATNVSVNTGQKGFDNTLKLRSDFRSEPTYKAFQEVDSAFRQINNGIDAKSPAGDLAAATKFMKLLDPGSVVRESELTEAMKATGKLDRLQNLAGNIVNGTKLTPKQREDFKNLATEFYNSASSQYNEKRGEYAGIAKRNDMNVEDVVGSEKAQKAVKPTSSTMPTQDAIQAEIDRRLGLKRGAK
jgi:hypothetical protein